jgi:Lrp/AsnC family transcriptional regulator, leucine-responsive regulatory protein
MPRDGRYHRIEILKLIQENSDLRLAEIATKVGLAQPSVSRTIAQLKKTGYIKATKAVLDPPKFGLVTLAYVTLSLKDISREAMDATANHIAANPYVQGVHRIAGEFDLFVKIRCRSNEQLAALVDEIKDTGNIQRSETTILTTTYKETLDIPVEQDE